MKNSLLLLALLLVFTSNAHAYTLGLYPSSNNYREVAMIEKEQKISIPMVGFIFDTFNEADAKMLANAIKTLGKEKIYHVTISPYWLSGKEVESGKYDEQYSRFFKLAKDSGARFVFRTMHEMNGSWYSWSGRPNDFKKAWKHVWNLSRELGLDQKNLLFAFSINSEDLPSSDGEVGWPMISCTPIIQTNKPCPTFEDFYPGTKYVDIMGMSTYNWGRGRSESWAEWKSFADILDQKPNTPYIRLARFHKPIFIDEVGTTAVNFDGEWKNETALEKYKNDTGTKNAWFSGMDSTLKSRPELFWALYFNRDKTYWLTDRSFIGELDWKAIGIGNERTYSRLVEIFRDPQSRTIGLLPFKKEKKTKILTEKKSVETPKSQIPVIILDNFAAIR